MGWWETDVKTGRVKEKQNKKGLINAIPGKDDSEKLYNGDRPADEMGKCLDKIYETYVRAWGREPYLEEIRAVFNFVFNGDIRGKKIFSINDPEKKREKEEAKEQQRIANKPW